MISPTDFRKQIDKRIQDLETVKNIETENETFQHFIDSLNEIITSAIFAFEATDLKKVYDELKLLESELDINRKKLNSIEATFLKIKIQKLGIYLQRLLREKGAKFKKGNIKLKEESLKGKARKYVKEKKFEGIGAGILAASDSPLFMILGKELDAFIAKKREKKDAKQNEIIQEIIDEYKEKLEEQTTDEEEKRSREIEKQRKELDAKISKGKAKEKIDLEKSIKSEFVDIGISEKEIKEQDERFKRYLERHGFSEEEKKEKWERHKRYQSYKLGEKEVKGVKEAREIKIPDKRIGGIYKKGEEFRKEENILEKPEIKKEPFLDMEGNPIHVGGTTSFNRMLEKQARWKKEAEEIKKQMAIPQNIEKITTESLHPKFREELKQMRKTYEAIYQKNIGDLEKKSTEEYQSYLNRLEIEKHEKGGYGEPKKYSLEEAENKKREILEKERKKRDEKIKEEENLLRRASEFEYKDEELELKKIAEKELKSKKAKRIKKAIEEGEISSVEEAPEFMRREEQKEGKEKKEKGGGLVKKMLGFGGGDGEVSKILYAYLPPIQSNTLRTVELLQKLKNTYESTYDEQTLEERDQTFKEIAENLGIIATGKKLDKDKETGNVKDNLKSLVPYIGMIGKGLAVVGAFGVGWMIGKKLDELLGITPFLQNIVDDLQGSLDDYTKKSLEKTTTKEQQKRTKELDTLKEKLGTNRFTNQKAYEISKNEELLNTLTSKEREVVMNKAKAYEKSKNVVDTGRRDISNLTLIPQSARGSAEKMDYFPRETITKAFSSPIANTSFENLKNKSIDNFENETADSITGRLPREALIRSFKESNLIFNNKRVDIDNLHPTMRGKLLQIADEYNLLTGRKLYINSAYRTKAEQERLYKKSPGKAAKPGTSMHEKGLAVDINSNNVNELKRLGLIRKYNFDTPVSGEPWHIEPTNARQLYNSMIEEQKLQAKTQIGDRVTGRSINNIENRETTNTNNNMAFAQNNYVVSPSDFRSFIDDPFLFHEFRNDYS
jgi:hypothetical protein